MNAKAFRCKECGLDDFTSPGAVARHYLTAHPKPSVANPHPVATDEPEDSDNTRMLMDEEEADDAELVLLAECTRAFIGAGTDREQDYRVLEYLAQRFGPLAYAEEPDAGATA